MKKILACVKSCAEKKISIVLVGNSVMTNVSEKQSAKSLFKPARDAFKKVGCVQAKTLRLEVDVLFSSKSLFEFVSREIQLQVDLGHLVWSQL